MTIEAYYTALAMLSDSIVRTVHDQRDPKPAVLHALSLGAPPEVDRVVALSTILAAQIDPMFKLEERLRWVRSLDPQLRGAA